MGRAGASAAWLRETIAKAMGVAGRLSRADIGRRGEAAAARYLRRRGLRIVARRR